MQLAGTTVTTMVIELRFTKMVVVEEYDCSRADLIWIHNSTLEELLLQHCCTCLDFRTRRVNLQNSLSKQSRNPNKPFPT